MSKMKDLAIELEEDLEQQRKQEQREEEAYQRQLIKEEFNFERDQGARP